MNKNIQGTFVSISSTCLCGEKFRWDSQPISGNMPLGNLILAGGILFSGNSPITALHIFRHINMQCISERTYFLMQQMYLVPTIQTVYQQKQQELLAETRQRGGLVRAGGDGRCCTPGHTAKFGSYSLMDLSTNKILDIQLVQVMVQLQVCFSKYFY